MLNRTTKFYLFALFIFLGFENIFAQEVGDHSMIRTNDGNVFQGIISNISDDSLTLQEINLGRIVMSHKFIKSQKLIDSTAYKYKIADLHSAASSKYVVGPSSFSLKKGEAYFHNTMLIYNNFSYGITDELTVGVGGFPTFIFDDSELFLGFSAKYSNKITNYARWSLGVSVGNLLEEYSYDYSNGVLGQASVTLGIERTNISFGYALSHQNSKIISVSGSLGLFKRMSLITEINYFEDIGETVSILSGRYLGKYFYLDAGIIRDDYGLFYGIGQFASITVPIRFKNSEAYRKKAINNFKI